jgi:two-component system KDP operon response regulator KdpE
MLLYRSETPAGAIASPLAIRQPESQAPDPLRVLLIEDEPEAANLVSLYLTERREDRFQVEWIPDLLDAMFRLQHGGVDVVLLDLGLPDRDGDKSFRAINGMTEGKLPIVILTSDDRPSSRELILASGAVDYLTKQQVSALELRSVLRGAVMDFRPKRKKPEIV